MGDVICAGCELSLVGCLAEAEVVIFACLISHGRGYNSEAGDAAFLFSVACVR